MVEGILMGSSAAICLSSLRNIFPDRVFGETISVSLKDIYKNSTVITAPVTTDT